MDGLAQKYADDVNFIYLDGTTEEGIAQEQAFGMRYHGYALVDRWGNLYWHSIGHSFTPEQLEQEILGALVVPPP